VNQQRSEGETPLIIAANRGHIGVIKKLLEFDADPNIVDNDGEDPLYQAAFKGFRDIFKVLVPYASDINR
jgi:ankyrin repeat protein